MPQLKVLAVNDPAVWAYKKDAQNNITKKWEESTGIEVVLDILEWDEYEDAVHKALKENKGKYDIVMNPGNFWIPFMAEEKLIIPLDEYLEAYDLDGIVQSIRKEMMYKGHIYMIPSFSDGHILFYRKDIFEQYGYQVDQIEMTTKQLKKCMEMFFQYDFRLALKAHATEILLDFLPFLWEEGVALITEAPYFSDLEKTKKALNKYITMKTYCLENVQAFDNASVKTAIQKGEAVIGVSWGGQAAAIMGDKENNRFIQHVGYMTYQHPCNTTWGFVINAKSQNVLQAVDYLKVVTNEANDKLVGRVSGSPIRYTSYKDEKEKKYCPWYPVQLHMLENAKHIPKTKKWGRIASRLYTWIHDVFTGEISSEDFIKQCVQDIK